MKKIRIIVLILCSLLMIALVVVFVTESVPPSVLGEYLIPSAISDEAWHESIKKDPTAHGYSAYDILANRGSDIAIENALKDIQDSNPYVWLNAASYLGKFNRKESVPYLTKALRHTALRSDEKNVVMLQSITGQNIGNDFNKWQEWYMNTPDPIKLDWESNLGLRPRIRKDNQQDTVADAGH